MLHHELQLPPHISFGPRWEAGAVQHSWLKVCSMKAKKTQGQSQLIPWQPTEPTEQKDFAPAKLLGSPQLTAVLKCHPPTVLLPGVLVSSSQAGLASLRSTYISQPWDETAEPFLSKPTPPASSLAPRTHRELQKELEGEKPALNWEWVRRNATAGWIRAPFPQG